MTDSPNISPDIYADGFSVTAGRFGVTLTLYRSEPSGEPGVHEEPKQMVGRIRLSPNLAKAIADALGKSVVASTSATPSRKGSTH